MRWKRHSRLKTIALVWSTAHRDALPIDEEPGVYNVDPCSIFAPTLNTAPGLPGSSRDGGSGSHEHHSDSEEEEAIVLEETVDDKMKDTPQEALTLVFDDSHAQNSPL